MNSNVPDNPAYISVPTGESPTVVKTGNLEVVVREGLGSMDQETATFVIIEIYDKGELMDSVAVSARSEAYKQGVFLLEFAKHYFARPQAMGE